MILNGVCLLWKGYIDMERLDGVGSLEFDEEMAKIEDAILREQVEAYNRRMKEFEEHRKMQQRQLAAFMGQHQAAMAAAAASAATASVKSSDERIRSSPETTTTTADSSDNNNKTASSSTSEEKLPFSSSCSSSADDIRVVVSRITFYLQRKCNVKQCLIKLFGGEFEMYGYDHHIAIVRHVKIRSPF